MPADAYVPPYLIRERPVMGERVILSVGDRGHVGTVTALGDDRFTLDVDGTALRVRYTDWQAMQREAIATTLAHAEDGED